MYLRVINIVDSIEKKNFGIYNAAINTSAVLMREYNVSSEVWFPEPETEEAEALDFFSAAIPVQLSQTGKSHSRRALRDHKLNAKKDLIVTHGCWRYPTRWGYWLAQAGFQWVYTPHGMLEPWSMQQKKWLKALYFRYREYPMAKTAPVVRAVGQPEQQNLISKFPRVEHIPNGVDLQDAHSLQDHRDQLHFLFLGRLHHKKGVVPLLKAWIESRICKNLDCRLTIAGPDEGELGKLRSLLHAHPECQNVDLSQAVYGEAKQDLLASTHYFLLPSFSEGFATSLVEAMAYGAVPIYTRACNFPEALEKKLAIEVEPVVASLREMLDQFEQKGWQKWKEMSKGCRGFVQQNYSLQAIAQKQIKLYRQLMPQVDL